MSRTLFSPRQIAAFRAAETDAAAALLAVTNTTCDVLRIAAMTTNSRFQPSDARAVVYAGIPCVVEPRPATRRGADEYADKLQGRTLVEIVVSGAYAVLLDDRIAVHGGTTYEVVGPPYPGGPFGTVRIVPSAAATPLATNA